MKVKLLLRKHFQKNQNWSRAGHTFPGLKSPTLRLRHTKVRAEQRQEASNQDLHILWPFGRKVGDELPGEMRLLQSRPPRPQQPPKNESDVKSGWSP